MKLYRTVLQEACASQTIERSRFIAYIKPVEDRAAADAFIASIREKHRDATHNVPAMVLGDKAQIQWASDDKEPQGTAGAPALGVLTAEGLTNVALVVTRYFGGVKLGTGGLVRAYSTSARLAVAAAGLADVEERVLLTCALDYGSHARLQSLTDAGLCTVMQTRYQDLVHVTLSVRPEAEADLIRRLSDLTGGRGRVTSREERRVPVPVDAPSAPCTSSARS